MDGTIRRLIGSEANRSYLRSLPGFRVERTLPADLAALLDELEQAEKVKPRDRRH